MHVWNDVPWMHVHIYIEINIQIKIMKLILFFSTVTNTYRIQTDEIDFVVSVLNMFILFLFILNLNVTKNCIQDF